MLREECRMKPYQATLFTQEEPSPLSIPDEPIFILNNKRYLNFSTLDCLNYKNNEYLKEAAKLSINETSQTAYSNNHEMLESLKKHMSEFKKIESMLLFSDELSACYALFSIFGPKTVFFIDYETSPSISAILQYRNVEFYSHHNLEHLNKIMGIHTDKVIVIDGLYEWLGYTGPINELIKIALENQAVIIANELNSFGLLGRDGRGFVELYNLYDITNIEIGSFSKYLGGFGTYIGAKKYLINKISENINGIPNPIPKFMVAVDLAGLELLQNEARNRSMFQKLWTNSRFFINRLKQIGLKTKSETPVIVVTLNNNDEAQLFSRRLFNDGILVAVNKERMRFSISIEHSRKDLDYALERIETHFKEIGIVYPDQTQP
uniref:Aminotransferase class I/II-fold pyridoxal phosphate-dependent enzyme n=1 Tax=candidate division WOR-3 bacterium TaxID=2052148 RepID=A0A7V3RJ69_UNCW3